MSMSFNAICVPKPKKETHEQIQKRQVAANHAERDAIRRKIAEQLDILAAHKPGTIRQAKSLLKLYRQELKDNIIHSGTLYNGGVW